MPPAPHRSFKEVNTVPRSYKLMPPLTSDEFEALKADIQENGVRVPVDVDEDGVILDGYNRVKIAGQLGVDYKTRTVRGLSEAGKRAHALRANLARRNLTREQRDELGRLARETAATLAAENPTKPQAWIAAQVGWSRRAVSGWLQAADQATGTVGIDANRSPPRHVQVRVPRSSHRAVEEQVRQRGTAQVAGRAYHGAMFSHPWLVCQVRAGTYGFSP